MTGRPQLERRIQLTILGSSSVEIDVTPAAIPEARGGVTLWVRCWKGTPLEETTAYTLTQTEAKELVAAIADVVTPELFRPPDLDEGAAP
jgi:hypothetical protein